MLHGAPKNDSNTRVLAGRYRLLRVVGHGGMGSVYEAIHIHTDKRVAVKLLSPQLSKDLKLVARFRREAMAASRLEHENCVRVDDFGEDADGTFYIAMEFVDGHGLADDLRKSGPMEPARVAHIALQLLKALDAAHAGGVLHRDLKPQNVMLTDKLHKPDLVKVVDFGIAKITMNSPEDQGALTVPGTIFGTPEYMSPEQARGEPLDVRSDLYSAAVVLWHMLLGRSPFRGTSVRETLIKVFSHTPALPSEERPNLKVPAGFEQVLLKAMAKKREDRYPDAASFFAALQPYVSGTPQGEIPRRPLPGMPRDGSAPPATLLDGRSATEVLPEGQLPALAAAGNTRVSDAAPPTLGPAGTRQMAMSNAPAEPGKPLLLGFDTVKRRTDRVALDSLAPEGSTAPPPPPNWPVPRLSRAALGLGALVILASIALFWMAGDRAPANKQPVVRAEAVARVEPPSQPDKPAVAVVNARARDAAMGRADQAIEHGDIAGARKAYTDAAAADPKHARALVGLATTAMQQKDWVAACGAFETVMALDAEYASKLAAPYALAKKLSNAGP